MPLRPNLLTQSPQCHLPQSMKDKLKRMAKLTRDYHKNLENEGLSQHQSKEEHETKTKTFLQNISVMQKIQKLAAF